MKRKFKKVKIDFYGALTPNTNNPLVNLTITQAMANIYLVEKIKHLDTRLGKALNFGQTKTTQTTLH